MNIPEGSIWDALALDVHFMSARAFSVDTVVSQESDELSDGLFDFVVPVHVGVLCSIYSLGGISGSTGA